MEQVGPLAVSSPLRHSSDGDPAPTVPLGGVGQAGHGRGARAGALPRQPLQRRPSWAQPAAQDLQQVR
eukprot:768063-Hanusia_phi.AAC.2